MAQRFEKNKQRFTPNSIQSIKKPTANQTSKKPVGAEIPKSETSNINRPSQQKNEM